MFYEREAAARSAIIRVGACAAGSDGRHDGRIDDAQAFQSADAHLSVDDQLRSRFERRRRVRVPHLTRAARVAETRGAASDVLLERLVGRGLRSGTHLLADLLRERRL